MSLFDLLLYSINVVRHPLLQWFLLKRLLVTPRLSSAQLVVDDIMIQIKIEMEKTDNWKGRSGQEMEKATMISRRSVGGT